MKQVLTAVCSAVFLIGCSNPIDFQVSDEEDQAPVMQFPAANQEEMVKLVSFTAATVSPVSQGIKVSANGRYFVRVSDNRPFLWLGDTPWAIFGLNNEDIDFYLKDRASRGFTVIQTATWGDLGNLPVPNESYMQRIDYVVRKAEEFGIMIGIIPLWAHASGSGYSRITTGNAEAYGKYLGNRYNAAKNVFWMAGGDQFPADDNQRNVWRLLAKGLAIGTSGAEDYSSIFMTHHPGSVHSSSEVFHNEPWLDFNMIETFTSHELVVSMLRKDYARTPPKPMGLAEGHYEGNHTPDNAPPIQIRNSAYWSFLCGGYYTYGNWPIYRFADGWKQALNAPGAQHLTIYKKFLESRSWWTYIPDMAVIIGDPGMGYSAKVSAYSTEDNAILVYYNRPGTATISMNHITGTEVQAFWFNPINGQKQFIGTFNKDNRSFTSPSTWEDAVLIIQSNVSSGIKNRLP